MRASALLLGILASCASPPVEEPDDPAALLAQLDDPDPRWHEDAACRLSRLGMEVPENEDTARMRAGINRALEERGPERMVWRAYHALRVGLLGRNWSRASNILASQEFRLVEIYEPHERAKFVRFLAQPAAYVNRAGDRHDLMFWVQSVRKEAAWMVREVYVGLNVKFDAPFKQLALADRYPKESVLGRFFALEELQTLAITFPGLEEIDFTYGRIRRKDEDLSYAGFHVNAGFVMDRKAGGRGVYYTAVSRFDPPERRNGRLFLPQYIWSEWVGPLQKQGAGYWGGGVPKPSEE